MRCAGAREGPGQPLLRGDELARELGIPRGPQVGELLRGAAPRPSYAGELDTREQALAYARTLAAATARLAP